MSLVRLWGGGEGGGGGALPTPSPPATPPPQAKPCVIGQWANNNNSTNLYEQYTKQPGPWPGRLGWLAWFRMLLGLWGWGGDIMDHGPWSLFPGPYCSNTEVCCLLYFIFVNTNYYVFRRLFFLGKPLGAPTGST